MSFDRLGQAGQSNELHHEQSSTPFETIETLTNRFIRRILELSRQPELTTSETTFIEHAADLSSRCSEYLIGQAGLPVPSDETTKRHLKEIVDSAAVILGRGGSLPTSEEVDKAPAKIIEVLELVKPDVISIKAAQRAAVEGYAIANLELLNDISENVGGIKLDSYLQANVQNMLAHYELAQTH